MRPAGRQPIPSHAKLVFKGILFDTRQREQELFDGSMKTFEKLRRPDTVLILPVIGDNILFIQEQQPGTNVMLRTIGGRIDEGESPEQAAHRELLEETGYSSDDLRLRDARHPVNKIDRVVYIFIAHIDKGNVVNPNHESGEKISLVQYPIDTILDPNNGFVFDDNEFLFKLHQAQINHTEKEKLIKLLTPSS